jgi:N4-gp56 family major capsid protein
VPTSAVTGTAQLLTDTAAYDRGYYNALRPPLVFDRCADVMPTNETHPGSSIVFNIKNDPAVATTPLTELSDPAGTAGSDSNVTVTLNEYGHHDDISAKLRGTSYLNELMRAANTEGYNAGKTQDTLARDPLLAGTGVDYSGAATSRVTVAATHVLTADEVRVADATLVDGNVQEYSDGAYRAFIAARVAFDLRKETGAAGWREAHINAGNPLAYTNILNGSVGYFEHFLFVQSPRLAAAELPSGFVNGGVGGTVDVYPTVFMGQEALAKIWSKLVSQPMAQPVLGPVTDSLRRFQTVGWYWLGGYGRFREASLFRWESASSIGAN